MSKKAIITPEKVLRNISEVAIKTFIEHGSKICKYSNQSFQDIFKMLHHKPGIENLSKEEQAMVMREHQVTIMNILILPSMNQLHDVVKELEETLILLAKEPKK